MKTSPRHQVVLKWDDLIQRVLNTLETSLEFCKKETFFFFLRCLHACWMCPTYKFPESLPWFFIKCAAMPFFRWPNNHGWELRSCVHLSVAALYSVLQLRGCHSYCQHCHHLLPIYFIDSISSECIINFHELCQFISLSNNLENHSIQQ